MAPRGATARGGAARRRPRAGLRGAGDNHGAARGGGATAHGSEFTTWRGATTTSCWGVRGRQQRAGARSQRCAGWRDGAGSRRNGVAQGRARAGMRAWWRSEREMGTGSFCFFFRMTERDQATPGGIQPHETSCCRCSHKKCLIQTSQTSKHLCSPMPLPAVSPTTPLPSDYHHHRLSSLLHPGTPLPHLLQLLAVALRLGLHRSSPLLSARLLSGLPQPHLLRLLHLLPPASLLPFNTALRALAYGALPPAAFAAFHVLLRAPLRPNSFTFSFLFKAALASKNPPLLVQQVHAVVAKSPFSRDPSVLNGLVLAYGKRSMGAESLQDARKVFDGMPDQRSACIWSCLISAYARCGLVEDALGLFVGMVEEGVRPEDDTMVGVVSACAKVHGAGIERWVNIMYELRGKIDRIFLSAVDTVIVYLYGKLGKVEEGRALFDKMMGNTEGTVGIVAWNCMVGTYVQNDQPVEALGVFHHMLGLGDPKPNHVTIVNLLSACASVGDLELGRWAYEYVRTKRRQGVIESNRILSTAFIDMFFKCGSSEEAQKVFERARDKDIVSFNAMIMGFATNGQEEKALMLFQEMEKCRIKPNEGTFLAVLCACTHSGLVDEGRRFFRNMSAKYCMMPNIEHYACYIDLLARAGHIGEALDVVKTMRIKPNATVWGALLGASLVHSKVDIAQNVAEKLVNMDPGSSAGYVLLSNAYAFEHTWPGIEELRGLMKVRGVRKVPGLSWININGSLYEFQVGSSSGPQFSEMCSILNSLSQEIRSMSS